MTLSFTTKWTKSMGALAGQPNYFVEKIWSGLMLDENFEFNLSISYLHDAQEVLELQNIDDFTNKPKLHTIRIDPSNRWKPGTKIHFVINNRTKNRFQFAPVVEVKSVQKIEIKWSDILENTSGRTAMNDRFVSVAIHDRGCAIRRYLNLEQLQILSINDGFNSVKDFFNFFNTDFTGKIIHWTNLKY